MLTFTAPGEHDHRVPGAADSCPCWIRAGRRPVDLARWNASHSRRWNHLRTRIKQAVPSLEFLRAIEVQKRGALHDHALVWSPEALDRVQLREWAIAAGFGHSVDVAEFAPGSRKFAYYVSKYVTKACDVRESVPWWGEYADRRTGEIRAGLVDARYRTWSSSRKWGLTMAGARAVCAEYARARAESARLETLAVLESVLGAAVVDGDPPPE